MPTLKFGTQWHRACECCGEIMPSLFPLEASPDWLGRRIGPRAWVAFLIIAVLILVQAINIWLFIGHFEALYTLAAGLLTAVNAFYLRRWADSPTYFQRLLLAAFTVLTPIILGMTLWYPDAKFRWRTFGFAMIFPKCLPPVLGLHLRFYAIYILFYASCEMFTYYLSAVVWSDEDPFRVYLTSLAFTVAVFAFGRSQSILMHRLSVLEDHIAYQKDANHALLSSLCDATFWLGSDANTIKHSDYRFDNLMGRAMLGNSLATVMEARGQLAGDILHLAGCQEQSVIVRPVTLRAVHGNLYGDLFAALPQAVKSKESVTALKLHTQQSNELVFLVGIRMCKEMDTALTQESRVPTLPVVANKGSVDHATDVSEFGAKETDVESALASLPRSTVTDRIFSAGTSSLHEIAMLGHAEHWLVDERYIGIFPQKILGAGSFGYVAQAEFHGVPVAMKIARNCMGDRNVLNKSMVNELRIHRRLRHPNVVQFLGAYADFQSGNLGLMYELIDGRTLQDIVLQAVPTPDFQYRCLADIASALRYMHDLVPILVHSDLKPANAMVVQWGDKVVTKLLDFGLAQRITRNASLLGGSKRWMAPEALHRKDPAMTPQMDTFSFGCLAMFVMTGESPATSEKAKLGESKPREANDSDSICASCARVILQCKEFDPRLRPCMKSVHIAVSKCCSSRFPEPGEVAETAPGEVSLPCREGIASLSRQAFTSDKTLMAIKVDLCDDHLPIRESTEAWRLFHQIDASTVDSIRSIFPDTVLVSVILWLQHLRNQCISENKPHIRARFGKCRARQPDGWQYFATLEAVVSGSCDSSTSTDDSEACIALLSWREVQSRETVGHIGSREVLWEAVNTIDL